MRNRCARLLLLCATVLAFSWQVSAQEYTYVKVSLGYPWFMFFVFLALIAIPFLIIIVLSWRQGTGNVPDSKHIKPDGIE